MRCVLRIPLSRYRPHCIILIALALLAGLRPAGAAFFTVDGSIRLNAIAGSIPASGTHHIRFTGAGYQNPGSLALTNGGSAGDSLIFERAVSTDSALRIDNVLLHLQGQKGTVVFRGLALKLNTGGALFDTNQSGNGNLVFDSCTILGDSVTQGKVLAWGGAPTSSIAIRNSQFAFLGSIALPGASDIAVSRSMFVSTGPISLSAASISLIDNLFNLSGVVSATVASRLEMRYNTSNRAQFLLDGNFTAACDIRNNYFANPPARNNLAQGGAQRYVAFFKGGSFLSDSSVLDNVRDSAWDGFDYYPPGSAMFSRSGNIAVASVKDSSVLWDWKIAGDNAHGAWNGPSPLPDFNLFPGASEVGLDLPEGRARFRLAPSPFPRLIKVTVGTTSYAAIAQLDSARSWFRSDTSLILTGSQATVLGLSLPPDDNGGTPLALYRTASGFNATVSDPAKDGVFPAPLATAREFVPALGGQNTFRGSDVNVTGAAPVSPLLVFPSVVRAGKTSFPTPATKPAEKRLRRITVGGQDVAFGFRSDAEGADSLLFGVAKAGLSAPFLADSLRYWMGGTEYIRARDSSGRYWGKAPSGKDVQTMLVEKLAFAPGKDTLALPQGALIANSAAGHQVRIDSAYLPSQADFPYMGSFGPALSFSWPGRRSGDSLTLILGRTDTAQKAYRKEGIQAVPIVPLAAEAHSLTLSLALADSLKAIFLARQYRVPADLSIDLALGPDSVKGLNSLKPGDIALDSAFRPSGLDTAQLRTLAARRLLLDSLQPQGTYTLLVSAQRPSHPDSVKTFVLNDTGWKPVTRAEVSGRYAFTADASIRAVFVAEALQKEEQTPAQPAQAAVPDVQGDKLILAPRLTASERDLLPGYRADLLSLDLSGAVRVEKSGTRPSDSATSLALAPDRLYAYRVIYQSKAGRLAPDTAWIPLAGKQPSADALQAAVPIRPAKFKYLIGFPFDADFAANVRTGFTAGPPEKLSLSELEDGRWKPVDVGKNPSLPRSHGYLMGASRPFRLQIGQASFPGLKADTLGFPSAGWRLFANPLPLPWPVAALGIDSSAVSLPLALRRDSTAAGSAYSWVPADTLRPCEGYLIYIFKPTRIAFAPLDLAALASAKRSAEARAFPSPASPAAAHRNGEIRLTLTTSAGDQSSVLYRNGPYLPTPYLPPPGNEGASVRFQAGGNGGWLYRKWERLDSIEMPIEIAATGGSVSEAGAALILSVPEGDAGPTRLLDWQTGGILDEAGMSALPLDAEPRRYTLLHGKAVEPGTAAFIRALPSAFALDQNSPNPFRGTTCIRFSIPAHAGRVLAGDFKVLSLDGRILEERSLGALPVGAHSLNAGNPSWRPGLYIYEIRIRTERGILAARKKMIYGGSSR